MDKGAAKAERGTPAPRGVSGAKDLGEIPTGSSQGGHQIQVKLVKIGDF